MSEGAVCHARVTWSRAPCTSNVPYARSYRPAPCLRYPKARSKVSSVRRRKTAMGWIFNQLLGHTALGLPRREMRSLAPRPGIQGHAEGVFPQDPRMFQTDLGSLAVARPHCFRRPQEKQAPCGPLVWYADSHTDCVPVGAKTFPDRTRLTGALLQSKGGGPDVWRWLCLSL